MYESDTFLAILDEGRLAHARQMVLRVGQKKFGPPSDTEMTAVKAIENLQRLDDLLERILDISSWQELLHSP